MTNIGRIIMLPKGEWDSTIKYEFLDVVTYQGSTWLAKTSNQDVSPVEGDTWQLMVATPDMTGIENAEQARKDAETARQEAEKARQRADQAREDYIYNLRFKIKSDGHIYAEFPK